MTPSLRAAVALAILMMRDRMTYRFAGFGTVVSLAVGLILLYLTTLSIQPTEAHIGINSQADLALFLISGGIMTSTLGIYSSQAASWIGNDAVPACLRPSWQVASHSTIYPTR